MSEVSFVLFIIYNENALNSNLQLALVSDVQLLQYQMRCSQGEKATIADYSVQVPSVSQATGYIHHGETTLTNPCK